MSKHTEHIVIIDDEQRMCESLSALLSSDSYQVTTFQDSSEALEKMVQKRIDLVITDIKMPKVSGLEVLEAVKKIDDGIPVILMTGYASMESAVEAISHGAYDYLMKPVEFARFELVVKRALEKRRDELDRLQLLEELKISNLILNRRIGELNALYEAGKSIGSTANLKELLKQIITLAAHVTDAQVGSIMLLDEDDQILTIEAAIGLEKKIMEETRLAVGESIAGHVAQTGEPLVIDDVESHKQFERNNQERYGAASLLCIPLMIKNKVIGVINIANKIDGGSFTENELRLLSTFASQAAIAVDDANQFERNLRRLTEFEILHDVNSRMSNIETMNDFRQMLVNKLSSVFPIDFTIWFDWNSSREILTPHGVSGINEIPLTESGGIDIHKVPREELAITDFSASELDLSDIAQLSKVMADCLSANQLYPTPQRPFMAIPILRRGELAHIFCIGAHSGRPYSNDDISLARLVISQTALMMEREKSLLNATRVMTMGNMISEISHDLRKPLTSIKGGLQVIRNRWPDVMEQSDFFKNVEDEVHRMNELVRELVDFSNPNKYQTEKSDLRHVVTRALELVAPDLKKSKIEYSVEFEDADWEIFANKNQVLEALLNLILNAVDAMPEGGKLSVTGLVERPDHKKVDYLAVKITDTGCGISKEQISRIFDRYFTTKETGTGLGLAVVERIISAHDGTLAVKSEENNGTTFTLFFPMKR
ncbi:MAG: GAF domain-containing protein [bacterium]|nr:GAF domain-containing protein [bacterium]